MNKSGIGRVSRTGVGRAIAVLALAGMMLLATSNEAQAQYGHRSSSHSSRSLHGPSYRPSRPYSSYRPSVGHSHHAYPRVTYPRVVLPPVVISPYSRYTPYYSSPYYGSPYYGSSYYYGSPYYGSSYYGSSFYYSTPRISLGVSF